MDFESVDIDELVGEDYTDFHRERAEFYGDCLSAEMGLGGEPDYERLSVEADYYDSCDGDGNIDSGWCL
jgi:hypothetical protein